MRGLPDALDRRRLRRRWQRRAAQVVRPARRRRAARLGRRVRRTARSPAEDVVDAYLGWTADYAQAVAAGMAVTVLPADVPNGNLSTGFARLVVVGVHGGDGAAELGGLLADHAVSDGLAFLRPGQPTNNLGGDGPDTPTAAVPAATAVGAGPDAAGTRARRRLVGRRPVGGGARPAGAVAGRRARCRRHDGGRRLVGRRRHVGRDHRLLRRGAAAAARLRRPRSRPPAPTPSATCSRSARCRRCASGASRSACCRSSPRSTGSPRRR